MLWESLYLADRYLWAKSVCLGELGSDHQELPSVSFSRGDPRSVFTVTPNQPMALPRELSASTPCWGWGQVPGHELCWGGHGSEQGSWAAGPTALQSGGKGRSTVGGDSEPRAGQQGRPWLPCLTLVPAGCETVPGSNLTLISLKCLPLLCRYELSLEFLPVPLVSAARQGKHAWNGL